MGQRANLIVVEGGVRTLYYDHWCANRLDVELFWGPALALEFVRQRAAVSEPDGWLDTLWCEGAALVDRDRSALTWFGGEDILFDVPRRRAHLALMARVWPGWQIRWAHEGILSIADAVGLARERFREPARDERSTLHGNAEFPEDNWVATSVRREDGELLVGRLCGFLAALDGGAALVDMLVAHGAREPLRWDGAFPQWGLHVDQGRRTLDVWWANDRGAVERAAAAWPGWTVRLHQDAYERHVELAGGRLILEPSPGVEASILDHLEACMNHEAGNPARQILEQGLLSRNGEQVDLNPASDAARASVGSLHEKRRILATLRG